MNRLQLLAIPLLLLLAGEGCGTKQKPSTSTSTSTSTSKTPVEQKPADPAVQVHADQKRVATQVKAFCGACHAVPLPDHFPRSAWQEEVDQGYQLYVASKRTDLHVPNRAEVLAYYGTLAPLAIDPPPGSQGIEPGGLAFRRMAAPEVPEPIGIAHLNWCHLAKDEAEKLLVCDMRRGLVQSATITSSGIELESIAKLNNPARIESCDLDQDSRPDFVVGDLGSYLPADHKRGRVVWLKRNDASQQFESMVIAENLGRVCDVEPCDMDGDGDQDLVTAEFGWRSTGRLIILENEGLDGGKPKFKVREIDPRHGAIHVPVVDLNHDGRFDFITVFSQEYESVEAFINDGSWKFRREPIFAADRPSFGSSGGSLADLDGDGDIDVLYTNGDLFDDTLLRSYHAVHWLENKGPGQWEHHELTRLAGVHRALAADMDRDGDLDIVACAFLANAMVKATRDKVFDSLIWLEQTSPGSFKRHVLENGNCHHATMAIIDLNMDGHLDLAVGNQMLPEEPTVPPFEVWLNESAATPGSQVSPDR